MGLIAELMDALRSGERVRFELSRESNGEVTILVQPYLGAPVEDLTGDVAALRAALAMPLRLRGRCAQLDAELPELLRRYGSTRAEVGGQIEALTALQEAAKAGARLTKQAGGKAPASAPPAGDEGPGEPASAPLAGEAAAGETVSAPLPLANPASLF